MNNSRGLNYASSIKLHIILSLLIFLGATFHGFFTAIYEPVSAKEVFLSLQKTFGPIAELPNWKMFLVLLLNNGVKALITSIAGILFGIPTLIFLWGNGFVIGIIGALFYAEGRLTDFFISVTPHGLFEISALILSSTLGFKLASVLPKKLFSKKGEIKKELRDALYFFTRIVAPLLFIAAAVEAFVTPVLIELFTG